jgi:hypothetical protein
VVNNNGVFPMRQAPEPKETLKPPRCRQCSCPKYKGGQVLMSTPNEQNLLADHVGGTRKHISAVSFPIYSARPK